MLRSIPPGAPDLRESKVAAGYTPKAMGPSEQCHACVHFVIPRACDAVKGDISPRGWCKRFIGRYGSQRTIVKS